MPRSLKDIGRVADATLRVRGELNRKRTADVWAEAERKASEARARKLQAPMPAPRAFANPFPRTPEAIEAERRADELLALRGRKVGKPRGS